jgi:hypothetical protein
VTGLSCKIVHQKIDVNRNSLKPKNKRDYLWEM